MGKVKACETLDAHHTILQYNTDISRRDHTPIRLTIQIRKLKFWSTEKAQYDKRGITKAMSNAKDPKGQIFATKIDEHPATLELINNTDEHTQDETALAYENFHYAVLDTIKQVFPLIKAKQQHTDNAADHWQTKAKLRQKGNEILQERLNMATDQMKTNGYWKWHTREFVNKEERRMNWKWNANEGTTYEDANFYTIQQNI